MKKISLARESTIRGFIEVDYSVGDENVAGIRIVTEDDDYIVEINGFGEDLLPFLDEEVEVSGIISEEEDGNKYIKVTGYDILAELPGDESFPGFDEDYEHYEEVIYGDSDDEYLH